MVKIALSKSKKRQKLLSRRANTSYLCFRTIIQLIYSMEKLQQHFAKLLRETDTRFHRYLYGHINWANRMVGLTGPRGVGKTTLVLQHIKENLLRDTSLYVTAEDFYFSTHRLADLAEHHHVRRGDGDVDEVLQRHRHDEREHVPVEDAAVCFQLVVHGEKSILSYGVGESLRYGRIARYAPTSASYE